MYAPVSANNNSESKRYSGVRKMRCERRNVVHIDRGGEWQQSRRTCAAPSVFHFVMAYSSHTRHTISSSRTHLKQVKRRQKNATNQYISIKKIADTFARTRTRPTSMLCITALPWTPFPIHILFTLYFDQESPVSLHRLINFGTVYWCQYIRWLKWVDTWHAISVSRPLRVT